MPTTGTIHLPITPAEDQQSLIPDQLSPTERSAYCNWSLERRLHSTTTTWDANTSSLPDARKGNLASKALEDLGLSEDDLRRTVYGLVYPPERRDK
jgi:hypothetical protein